MKCLYCGKKIPLVRRLKQHPFCCQEHRQLHAESMAESGLARLMETPAPAKFAALAALPQMEAKPELPYGGFGVALPMSRAAVRPTAPVAERGGPRPAPEILYHPGTPLPSADEAEGPVGIAFPVTLEITPIDVHSVRMAAVGLPAACGVMAVDDRRTAKPDAENALARAGRLYRVLPHRWITGGAAPKAAGAVADLVAQVSSAAAAAAETGPFWKPMASCLVLNGPAMRPDCRLEPTSARTDGRTEQPCSEARTDGGNALWNLTPIRLPDLAAPLPTPAGFLSTNGFAAAHGGGMPTGSPERVWHLLPAMPDGCGTILRIDAPQLRAIEGTCELTPDAAAPEGGGRTGELGECTLRVDPVLDVTPPAPVDLEAPPEADEVDDAEIDRVLASLDFSSAAVLPVQNHIPIAPEPVEDNEVPELVGAAAISYKKFTPAVAEPARPVAVASAPVESGSVAVLEEPQANFDDGSNRTVPSPPCGKEPIVFKTPDSIIRKTYNKLGSLPLFRALSGRKRPAAGQLGGAGDDARTEEPVRGFLGEMNSVWKSFPQFFRGVALVAVPLLIPTLFYARISPSDTVNGNTWENMKLAIRNRATVLIEDDFRTGLRSWSAPDDAVGSWQTDEMSFVQPGRLALLQKSVPLADYRLEFLAKLEDKSLSFVTRAADMRNYYVSQLVVMKGGPLPVVHIVRYPVIEGIEGPRTDLPLPIQLDLTRMFTVLATVRGENFTVSINGQMVDNWSDNRFGHGGVGFFTEKGARYRLKWVRVVDKDDFLGWLCSRISPGTADIRASGEHQ